MITAGLKLEKIWSDLQFFEVRITFLGDKFKISSDIYTDNDSLNELRLGLLEFIEQLGKCDFLWISGSEEEAHFLSMRFFLQEKRGIVGIEVTLDNNEEPPYRLRSNFYLITDFNQIDDLARKVEKFIEEEITYFEGLILV